jgi:two-component system cell cycle response regulator
MNSCGIFQKSLVLHKEKVHVVRTDMSKKTTQILDLRSLRQEGEAKTNRSVSAYLIVINGERVGEMFKLTKDEICIGRAEECDLILSDDGVSRRHCMINRAPNGGYTLLDNESTNGTFANGERAYQHALADGDKIQLGQVTILKFSYQDDLEEAFQRRMYEAAVRDPLTGIYNKRYFTDRLRGEYAYSIRHAVPLSLLLFDIDHFKRINDTYGHPAGDTVLKGLAQVVSRAIRAEDIFARYGGEEFAVIARELESAPAYAFAERLRRIIETTKFEAEGYTIPVTVSIGIATLGPTNFLDEGDMIRESDQNLYAAKRSGRNRVERSAPANNR